MQRRNVIKSLGIGLLGIGQIPAWATNWNKKDFNEGLTENTALFEKIVDCLIPETKTPGAKSIGAHVYVEKVIKDCYSASIQSEVKSTLDNLNKEAASKYQKTFGLLDDLQAIEILKGNEVNKKTILFLKNLTIRSYTSSEYYLTTHKNYQMAPAFFYGCVEI